jgi:putative nucleotidyltransferase with HDIG domain
VLDKLFESSNPAGALRLGHETGLLQHLFPAVHEHYDFDQQTPHHRYSLGDHLLNTLHNVSEQTDDPDVRMAAFLHDIGKPASQWFDENGVAHYYQSKDQGSNHEDVGAKMAEDNLRDLHYPTARIRRVTGIIQNHMFPAFSTNKGARKFLQRTEPYADDLLTLRRADMEGKGQAPEEVAQRTSVDKMQGLVEQARSAGDPTSQSALSVNGNDIVAMGAQGPDVGQILRQLTNDVVEEPMLNDRQALLQRAQQYIKALPSNPHHQIDPPGQGFGAAIGKVARVDWDHARKVG